MLSCTMEGAFNGSTQKKRKKKKEKTSCSTYWVVVQVDDDQSGVIQGAGKKVVAGYTASPEFRGLRSSLH
jgi:hypothetical protein